ncbi:MAG: DNA recombination protein RmuC [Phycisphaerales bacterium JB043]
MDPLSTALVILCALLLAACGVLAWANRSRSLSLREARRQLNEASLELARLAERHDSVEQTLAQERERFESQNTQMREAFEALSNKALDRALDQLQRFAKESLSTQSAQAKTELEQRKLAVEHLVKPIQESLSKTHTHLQELETRRQGAYGSLRQQVETMSQENTRLRTETSRLVAALAKPQVRGRYGEIQLQRIAEIAGMREYCDFDTQTTLDDDAGSRYRPDMIVRLPNERVVIVDAKTNTESYMRALQSDDPNDAERHLQEFARHVRDEAGRLAARGYTDVLRGRSPEFVVMFIPADQLVDAALEREHSLLEHAASKGVIIASPSTLIGLLRAVHVGWGEKNLSDHAEELFELGRELHERASVALEKAAELGLAIQRTGKKYDDFVGSVEARLLPTLRKFEDTKAKSSKTLPELKSADIHVRSLQSAPSDPAES